MSARNTSQKKVILDTLASLRTHPTIYELYDEVKKANPKIGMATVYRNIKKYSENGTVTVIKTNNGEDRYDYYKDHIHFECLNCKKIIDIFDVTLVEILKNRSWNKGLKVEKYNILISGYCSKCQ